MAELRRAIGYVPQDTFLFSETIRENIGFGVENVLDEAVLEAAEIASISGEIQGFPDRFSTILGERGITFRAGRGSERHWRAQSPASRRFWCSMTRFRAWIRPPKSGS